jgi:hypothetical protein
MGETGRGGREADVGAGGEGAQEGGFGRLGHPAGGGEAELEAA